MKDSLFLTFVMFCRLGFFGAVDVRTVTPRLLAYPNEQLLTDVWLLGIIQLLVLKRFIFSSIFLRNGKKKTTAVIERYSIYVFFLLSYETNLE